MTNNITSKDLEVRAKKIFDSLGLKNLDIKLSCKDSSGETSQHVHVDENGVTSDNSSKANSEEKKVNQDTVEKATKRLSNTANDLFEFCTGKIDNDSLMRRLKSTFEQRMRDQFGITDNPLEYAKEIDRVAKNFFNEPFFKNTSSALKALGIDIDQESINDAAKKLLDIWGYNTPKTEKCKTEESDKTQGMTKSQQILNEIKKEEEAKRIKAELEEKAKKEAKEKNIAEVASALDKALTARDFVAICNNTAIKLQLSVPKDSEYEDILSAVEQTASSYGFSSFRVSHPSDYSVVEVIFAF